MDNVSITVPSSLDDAVAELNGIGELLTAKEWHRAAIVYAFTENGRGKSGHLSVLDAKSFAELGIVGLRSEKTVRHYRSAWEKHGSDVAPGATVTLPTIPFPARDDANFGNRVSPDKAVEAVGEWSPEAKAAAAKALIADDDVTETITTELAESRPELIDKAMDKAVALTPDVPAAPARQRTMDDCYREIEEAQNHMLVDMSTAIRCAEEAIQNGWGVGDLEWAALAQTPGLTLQESFTEFGKLVAMIQIDKARI